MVRGAVGVLRLRAVRRFRRSPLVLYELRFPEPIIDFRMFKIFGFTLAVAIISFQALALFSINLLNPLFMEHAARLRRLEGGPRGRAARNRRGGRASWRWASFRAAAPICVRSSPAASCSARTRSGSMSHWGLAITMSAVLWPILFSDSGWARCSRP